MTIFLQWLCQSSCQAAILAVIVTLLSALPAITPRWRTTIWLIVLARLLLPVLPSSRLSLFRLAQTSPDQPSLPAPIMNPSSTLDWKITLDPVNHPSPPPPVLPPPPIASTLSLPTILFLSWLTGATLLAARFAAINISLATRLRRSAQPPDAQTLALLHQCCRQLKIPPPPLIITPAIHSPALTGFPRPKLLLPPRLAERLDPSQLRLIFLHELTHLKSRDLFLDWFWIAAQILHWFNPFAHLARWRYSADRELARDAAVLAITPPPDRHRYGQTIIQLAALSPASSRHPALLGILGQKSQLRHRIAQVAQFDPTTRRISLPGLLAFIAVGCAGLTSPPPPTSAPASLATAPSPTAGPLVIRVYDVRDLLIVPDRTDLNPSPTTTVSTTTQFTQNPAVAVPPRPPPDVNAVLLKLINSIEDSLGQDVWRQSGGKIQVLADTRRLVITETEQNQQRIEQFLHALREVDSRMITISSRFLSLDATVLAALPDSVRQQIRSNEPLQCVVATLSPDQVRTLLLAVEHNNYETLISAPRVTLFSGGRATLSVERNSYYVDSLTLPKGATKYLPHLNETSSGIRLDLKGTISDDEKYATMQVHSTLSILDGFETIPFIAPDGTDVGDVQRPVTHITTVRSNVSAKDNDTVLITAWFPSPTTLPADLTRAETRPSALDSWHRDQPFCLLLTPHVLHIHEISDTTRPKTPAQKLTP